MSQHLEGDLEGRYLFLPSSVADPDIVPADRNTLSHYETKLANPLRLDPRFPYEAALVKLIYTTSAQNIVDAQFESYSYATRRFLLARVPDGYYKSPDALMKTFQRQITEQDRPYYVLAFDSVARKFNLFLRKNPADSVLPQIKFITPALRNFLGLHRTDAYSVPPLQPHGFIVFAGETPWDVAGGHDNIYLYTDLVQHSPIGNGEAPVMTIVNYFAQGDLDAAVQVEYQPKHLIYLPVNKRLVQRVRVELRTKTGQFFPFAFGETIVVIHIRPKI